MSEDEFMVELSDAVDAHDSVPPSLVAAAKSAFVMRRLDDELAELLDQELLAVRQETQPDLLTFEADGLVVDIDIDRGTISGQLVPAQVAHVEVETTDGVTAEVDADESGQFVLDSPRRPCRLVVRAATSTVRTDWFRA